MNSCYYIVEEVSGFISGSGLSVSGYELTPETFDKTAYNILLPADLFKNIMDGSAGVVFSFYSTSVLFPLRINQTDVTFRNSSYATIGSSVIAATVANNTVMDLKNPIKIAMEITTNVSMTSMCVVWLVSRSEPT